MSRHLHKPKIEFAPFTDYFFMFMFRSMNFEFVAKLIGLSEDTDATATTTDSTNSDNVTESDPVEKNYDNYVSRKYRDRRGKRDKTGRVMEFGEYHRYDDDSLQIFNAYKSTARRVRSSMSTIGEAGHSALVGTYNATAETTRRLFGIPYPPIASQDVRDLSSISFSGGGYNCAYHLGVIQYIFENPSHFAKTVFLGASGGAGVAAITLAYLDDPDRLQVLKRIHQTLDDLGDGDHSMSKQVERYTSELLNYIDEERFERTVRRSKRLHISLTEVGVVPANRVIDDFDNLKHLVDTIRASACVPILLDNQIRTVKDKSYVDGGLSDNLPAVDENTIRISCLNYPTLRAELYPSEMINIVKCFVHPGKEEIGRMREQGLEDFGTYIGPYVDRLKTDAIEKQIAELENEFVDT